MTDARVLLEEQRLGLVVSALVCDDVRRESNGKELHIGVYSGGINVPVVPFILSKLCFVFTIQGDLETQPDVIICRIRLPGQASPMETRLTRKSGPRNQTPGARYFRIGTVLEVSPIALRETGRILFSVLDGETERLFGALRVQVTPPKELDEAGLQKLQADAIAEIAAFDAAMAREVPGS